MKIKLSPDITVTTKQGPKIEIFLCHVRQIDSRTLKALVNLAKCAARQVGAC